ncbi:MAG TPA: NAD-dependent epimerase/dehydratase family protein [Terriglobia bacterium]|nr:NAD-dependent epimerase/dehydratase family protein [Terriglobia bacterium]
MATKSVLVTGATGFLGKHLVEQLKAEPDPVRLRVFCRGLSPWEQDAAVEVVHGDIVNRQQVQLAANGVSEIYHLAGIVSRDAKDQDLLYETHIEGIRNVCEAALEHKVSKVVVVSSSGTIAVGTTPTVYNETSGYKNDVLAEWPYYLSKIFAEKLALDYHARTGLNVVIVNPSLLLGVGDERNSSTRDVALFLQDGIKAIPKGGLNFVDVRDVAHGLSLAMERGKPGERYLMGNVNWTFRQLIEKVAEISGKAPPSMEPPLEVSLWGARAMRVIYPLLGKKIELDDASVKMSACYWYCDSTKARNELGFQTRSPEETLKDTVEDVHLRLYRSGQLPPVV